MKKILLLMLIMIPAVAFARFEKLTNDIDEMFARFTGIVVSAEDNDIITDLGREKGVYPGMELKIFRNNEPIIHPITKQVLGNKKIFIGDVLIKEVFDGYSNAKLTKQARAVKPGDVVAMNPPVDVAVSIDSMPVRLELLLKEELGQGRNYIVKDSAPIVLTFTQKEEGGIGYTVKDSKSGSLIYSRYFSDKDLGQGVGVIATKDIMRSKEINEQYKSMAVGHAKPDGKIYIAAATDEKIDLFIFTGNAFESAGTVGAEFDNIQNIELADVDSDGTDELFVTEVKYETTVRSTVLEFNGSAFIKLVEDAPYIYRTVHVKGEKRIVAQKLSTTGSPVGMVHKLINVNGSYERGASVSASKDISIYGFGYSDLNNDGTAEVLSIDKDYKLNVYNGSSVRYTAIEEFGQTPYYFILKNEVIDDIALSAQKKGYKSGDEDPFVYESIKNYIKGRIFVNSDNNIYVVQNEHKYKMFENTKVFGASSFAVYSWDGRRLRSMWKSEVFEPTIADYYMYEEFGRTYLFMLRNFRDGILSDDKSQFIYIETK